MFHYLCKSTIEYRMTDTVIEIFSSPNVISLTNLPYVVPSQGPFALYTCQLDEPMTLPTSALDRLSLFYKYYDLYPKLDFHFMDGQRMKSLNDGSKR